jgi:hypothetical protein
MSYEDYLNDAIDQVSAWNLPDDEFAQTVNDLALLMAGDTYLDTCDTPPAVSAYTTLRF